MQRIDRVFSDISGSNPCRGDRHLPSQDVASDQNILVKLILSQERVSSAPVTTKLFDR
jgi:hypothetical protein